MNGHSATASTIDRIEGAAHAAARAPRSRHVHSTATRLLHWSSVVALVLATVSILVHEYAEAPALRAWLLDLHRQAGLVVLLACVARLVVRLRGGLADTLAGMPLILKVMAHAAHLALYAALLALPLLGWATTNAHGVPMRLLGLLPLPHLVGEDADLAERLSDFHAWAAWAMLALVLAHVAAALWHHAVRRDGVLLAMLPQLQRRRAR